MNAAAKNASAHVLVYEPRVEGHHPTYLKFVTEDLLGAGYRLTLAIDQRPEPLAILRTEMADLLDRVAVIPACDAAGKRAGGGNAGSVAACLQQSGADYAFLTNFDEIGSAVMRKAAFGLLPPAALRGRIGGIYIRPRFLGALGWSLNQRIKARGFWRLLRERWFTHLLLLDPYLAAELKARAPETPAFHLPDPYPENFTADRAAARREFALPDDACVFLFYGAAYRRKGLDLAVEAMGALPPETKAFLLCAGRQVEDAAVARGLEKLAGEGRARVINRYISNDEEKRVFAASDVVLLPYRRHFGNSGVLMRAVGAARPVIVSDEELMARLVRERGLGLTFAPGNAAALAAAMQQMAQASADEMTQWQNAARAYAPSCSRAAFRAALLAAFRHGVGAPAKHALMRKADAMR